MDNEFWGTELWEYIPQIAANDDIPQEIQADIPTEVQTYLYDIILPREREKLREILREWQIPEDEILQQLGGEDPLPFAHQTTDNEKKEIILRYINQPVHYALIDYSILEQDSQYIANQKPVLNKIVHRCITRSPRFTFLDKNLENENLVKLIVDNIYTSKDAHIIEKFRIFLGNRVKSFGSILNKIEDCKRSLETIMLLPNNPHRTQVINIQQREIDMLNQDLRDHENTHATLFKLANKYKLDPVQSVKPNIYTKGLDFYNKITGAGLANLPKDLTDMVTRGIAFGHKKSGKSRKSRKKSKRRKSHKRS